MSWWDKITNEAYMLDIIKEGLLYAAMATAAAAAIMVIFFGIRKLNKMSKKGHKK